MTPVFSWKKGKPGNFESRRTELHPSAAVAPGSWLVAWLWPWPSAAGEDEALTVIPLERSIPGRRGQRVPGAATSGEAAGALTQLSQPLTCLQKQQVTAAQKVV